MASSADFVSYITEQLGGESAGVTHCKMFGEYGYHRYGKFFAAVCGDALYVKPTVAGRAFLESRDALVEAPPYEGAKDYFLIENVDDSAFLQELSDVTVEELPLPKPRKKKAPKAKGEGEKVQ